MKKRKIAIACQGGGSQTAFTAGALKALFDGDFRRDFQLVGLSGTSGGSLCAALVWYALLKGDDDVPRRMLAFWADNTAQTPLESVFNHYLIESLRATNRGMLPQFSMSPYSPYMQAMAGLTATMVRGDFTNLRGLLEKHIDFAELKAAGPRKDLPALLLGAADVLSGRLVKFNSRDQAIRLEHLLSSCAVPSLFPAVEIDGGAYWDGLFSDNPPINEFVKPKYIGRENIPHEIWVIKINPTGTASVPQSPEAINDRRNEMVGNMSLFHQLGTITILNNLVAGRAFRPEMLDKVDITEPVCIPRSFPEEEECEYHIPFIEMSPAVQASLDYESKLDRSPEHIRLLIEDGERQAGAFLAHRREALA